MRATSPEVQVQYLEDKRLTYNTFLGDNSGSYEEDSWKGYDKHNADDRLMPGRTVC